MWKVAEYPWKTPYGLGSWHEKVEDHCIGVLLGVSYESYIHTYIHSTAFAESRLLGIRKQDSHRLR